MDDNLSLPNINKQQIIIFDSKLYEALDDGTNSQENYNKLKESNLINQTYEAWKEQRLKEEKPKHNGIIVTENETPNELRIRIVTEHITGGKLTELMTCYLEKHYIFKSIEEKREGEPDLWVYANGIWENSGFSIVAAYTRLILGASHTEGMINQIVTKIRDDNLISEKTFRNTNPQLLPVQNGVLDLKDLENIKIIPYAPEQYFFSKLPVKYDAQARCPKFINFLEEVVDLDNIDLINEFMGFCLWRGYPYQSALMLIGEGRNGKGAFLDIIRNFFGIENRKSLSYKQISDKDGFERAGLYNKLINICGDDSGGIIETSEGFKELTGGDEISAKRKHIQKTLDFTNHAKFIFSYNETPTFKDMSDGNLRRWMCIIFPHRFFTQTAFNLLPIEERKGIKIADESKIKAIQTEEEYSGMLNLFLEGLKGIFKYKGFSYTLTTQQTIDLISKYSNPYTLFVNERVEEAEGVGSYIVKSELEKEYLIWCKENNIQVRDGYKNNRMRAALAAKFGIQKYDWYNWEAQKDMGDGNSKVYVGMRLANRLTKQPTFKIVQKNNSLYTILKMGYTVSWLGKIELIKKFESE